MMCRLFIRSLFTLIPAALAFGTIAAQQRIVGECMITYKVTVTADTLPDKDMAEALRTATRTVYIKGSNTRNDLTGAAFSQSTYFDKNSGEAVVLREFGNDRFITRLDTAAWARQNERFSGAAFVPSAGSKTIAGYECRRGTVNLKDGTSLTVYYSTAITPSVKEFEYCFREVPGLVLEYSGTEKGQQITYTAAQVNLSPVPVSRFEIPTKGYRML